MRYIEKVLHPDAASPFFFPSVGSRFVARWDLASGIAPQGTRGRIRLITLQLHQSSPA